MVCGLTSMACVDGSELARKNFTSQDLVGGLGPADHRQSAQVARNPVRASAREGCPAAVDSVTRGPWTLNAPCVNLLQSRCRTLGKRRLGTLF
jgi:hypothetical protein